MRASPEGDDEIVQGTSDLRGRSNEMGKGLVLIAPFVFVLGSLIIVGLIPT